jgi:SM-20-related protein
MSRNTILKTLGLFVEPDCLPADLCQNLREAMLAAPGAPASVDVNDTDSAVERHARLALSVDVPASLGAIVQRRLDARRDDLARHFGVNLATCEEPQYLVYEPGGLYRPHVDARPAVDRPGQQSRLVSVVIFLSTPETAGRGDYEGGELRLFNLVDGPEWRGVGLACDAVPGLLLAFRSDTIHEVTTVTRGFRCAIATWFR